MTAKTAALLPNLLTGLRVILTLVLVVVLARRVPGLAVAFWLCLAILLTDYLDGRLARRLGACSAGGALADVAADGFYALAAAVSLGRLGLVPAWYVALVAGKLAEFATTSWLQSSPGRPQLVFDPLGRLASALFMAIPPVALGWHHLTGRPVALLAVVAAATALLSAVVRVAALLKRAKPGPSW